MLGLPLPGVEIGIAVSGMVLGLLVLLDRRLPLTLRRPGEIMLQGKPAKPAKCRFVEQRTRKIGNRTIAMRCIERGVVFPVGTVSAHLIGKRFFQYVRREQPGCPFATELPTPILLAALEK